MGYFTFFILKGSQISSAQEPQVAGGYHIGSHKYRHSQKIIVGESHWTTNVEKEGIF